MLEPRFYKIRVAEGRGAGAPLFFSDTISKIAGLAFKAGKAAFLANN